MYQLQQCIRLLLEKLKLKEKEHVLIVNHEMHSLLFMRKLGNRYAIRTINDTKLHIKIATIFKIGVYVVETGGY